MAPRGTGTPPPASTINWMAFATPCTPWARTVCFGLTGGRRTVPHPQGLLQYPDDELKALESAAGVA